jgi:hypothetical protein
MRAQRVQTNEEHITMGPPRGLRGGRASKTTLRQTLSQQSPAGLTQVVRPRHARLLTMARDWRFFLES